MIIKIDEVKLNVLNIETIASNEKAGRYNLVEDMKAKRIAACLWVEKPRGKKIGFVVVGENGNTTAVKWQGGI